MPLGEVNVPLFALTSVPEFEQRLKKGAKGGLGKFSHFEVFATLLVAMGYDAEWVHKNYGPSLMDPPPPNRRYMIGNPDFQPMMIPVNPEMESSSFIEPRQPHFSRVN